MARSGRWKRRAAGGEPPDSTQALSMAWRLLAGRDHSRRELCEKLSRRGVDAGVAHEVLERLEEDGLLDDQRFAESFVRQRAANGYGPFRIRLELRSRGVSEEMVQQALEPHADSWHQRARDWIARQPAGPLDRKAKGRLYRGGQRRGFSHDQVMRAIDWLESGLEDADPS